jgi:hypothetical protein
MFKFITMQLLVECVLEFNIFDANIQSIIIDIHIICCKFVRIERKLKFLKNCLL